MRETLFHFDAPLLNHPPDTSTPRALKSAWSVTAGILPGEPIPELSRQWSLSDLDWDSPAKVALFNAALMGALEYARVLMHPGAYNWVKVEWIWLLDAPAPH